MREARKGLGGTVRDGPRVTGTSTEDRGTSESLGGRSPNRRSPSWRARRFVLVVWDAAAWAFALVIAYALRFELHLEEIDIPSLQRVAIAAIVAQILIGGVLQVYRGRYRVGSLDDAINVAGTTALAGLAVFVVNSVLGDPGLVPRSVPLVAVPIAVLFAVGVRLASRLHRERNARPDRGTAQRVIIFGAGNEGQILLHSMLSDPHSSYLPVGLLDDDPRLRRRRISGVAVLGTRADIAAAASRSRADLLVITSRAGDDCVVREISCAAIEAGLGVKVVPPLAELLRPVPSALLIPAPGTAGHRDGEKPADLAGPRERAETTRPVVQASPFQHMAKRSLDIVLSLLSLVIVLPLLLVIAVVLKLNSGQVLYRAKRVGRDGKTFTMFKFSTMVADDSGPRVTREGDPRITPVGRWLRTSKLNELPQIFNVIKGDMSLVGPRPEDPIYAAFYSERQRRVLSVRPGMTSLAFLEFGDEQLFIERARPADIETYYLSELLPEKLDIELKYVNSWTVLGDLRIVLRTVAELLS
jgi:lipopolysaccharide/colanic/teichoic acid biosynthesis glycosyltransferase